jgi:hypothetical protein
MNQFHAVVIDPIRNDDARLSDESVASERAIIDLMLPAVPFARDLHHVRVLALQGSSHFKATVEVWIPCTDFPSKGKRKIDG